MSQKTKASRNKASSTQTKQSWIEKMAASRYGVPAVFILVFVSLGVSALYWVSAASSTYSLWGDDNIPKTITASDANSTEVGLKFQSKVTGYVNGLRFYKGAQNTGLHTGHLWSGNGDLLASVTFSNETAKGWQSATFKQPISIAANVTYVISYHAPNGHYSENIDYFRNQSHDRRYLTALRSNNNHPNGVYAASNATRIYPTQNGNGTNYWVDVLFSNKLVSPKPGPAVPGDIAASAQGTSVTLSWKASASAKPIREYIVYRNGKKLISVGTVLGYTDAVVKAGTTYGYQVQAIDKMGASSELSTTISAVVPR